MKLKTLFSSVLVALSTASFAQTWTLDSVAMGAGYANDVFYELKNGSTKYQVGNDWHLAFQMAAFPEANFNASVRVSHVKKGVEVYALTRSATANIFNNISAVDTVGKTGPALQLNNNDTSWGTGALYQARNLADPFSYGWGEYSTSSHNLTGTTVFLIKTANGAFKLWVQQYISNPVDSIRYTFRIARLDGSDDKTVNIYRKGGNMMFTDRLFAYYNIDSNFILNREPSRQTWDMVFTQFKQEVYGPGGVKQLYPVTGVLTNQGVEVAEVRQIDVNDAAHEQNFKTYSRSTKIDEIGSDWKTFDNSTFMYTIADSTSYFVRTRTDNAYYQMVFKRFDGGSASGQGKIVFAKRYLGTALAVNHVAAASVKAWFVAPNPSNSGTSVMIDAREATPSARLIVTDMAGRSVANMPVSIRNGMNAFSLQTGSWPAGMYAVQLAGEGWKLSTRLVVAH